MFMRHSTRTAAAGAIVLFMSGGMASAVTLEVKVTNLQGQGGLFLTPLFSIFHDGSYDSFSVDDFASPGLEAIAEEGDVSVELAATMGQNNGVILAPGGFPGAPVLDPGETATQIFHVDPMSDRFFSFLSMIIPSNDLFIGNGNPMANQIFDMDGNFTGGSIFLSLANIYDGGTEENNNLGAAFNGRTGATATDEMKTIQLVGDVSFLLGEPTVAGGFITNIGNDLIRIDISVVPVPAALPLLVAGLGALGLVRRRRTA